MVYILLDITNKMYPDDDEDELSSSSSNDNLELEEEELEEEEESESELSYTDDGEFELESESELFYTDDESEEEEEEKESEEEEEEEEEKKEEEEEEEKEYHRPRLVSIEGNIGAGKTTLICSLKEKYQDREDILFLEEPVDIWNTIQDKNEKTILQYFYEDLGKYAFPFQVMAYITRLQLIKNTIENASEKVKVIVMERSLEADTNIFAKMLYEEWVLNTIEYQVYSLLTENKENEYYGIDGIIWLRTEPEECYHRVLERNRKGEQGLDLEYLRKCHQYHLEWLDADLGFTCNIGGGYNSSSSSSSFLNDSDLEKIDRFLF
jgi:deoxyadenosine/deoxycytidine kinase